MLSFNIPEDIENIFILCGTVDSPNINVVIIIKVLEKLYVLNLNQKLKFVIIMHILMCIPSHFSPVRLFMTLWTMARQASLSKGILQARILLGTFQTKGLSHIWCGSGVARGFFATETPYSYVDYYLTAIARFLFLQSRVKIMLNFP